MDTGDGMGLKLGRGAWLALAALLAACLARGAIAAPTHGIAMYGEPALLPDFVALPYANPDAPKGGEVIFGTQGTFDSLNPYILKGKSAEGVSAFTVETLMARSLDEPFTLYGLLAESVETPPDRSWVEFTLRPEAKFSDGSPVTVDDVVWSLTTLGTKGHPRYINSWKKVAKVEATGPRKVRITFSDKDRELALLMGMRPILKKSDWDARPFDESALTPFTGSGPYVIDKVDPGKSITFRRNPDYWGKDLAINRGKNNFDRIRYDYYGDANLTFQAFVAGDSMVYREDSARKWQGAYDFPDMTSGKDVKEEIPNGLPSGIAGLVMNMRNPIFADWRVREAMILAFNFEFINRTLNGGTEPRISSYFGHSRLAMEPGPATGQVADLLAPFAADLPPGTIEGYTLPVSSPDKPIDRKNMRAALKLFEEAGWTVKDGVMQNAEGKPFAFDILITAGATDSAAVAAIYVEGLKQMGLQPTISTVDSTQYQQRTNDYAFDMAWYVRSLSLSPGNEQMLYWGSDGVKTPGTRNWMGMNSPAAESMIRTMVDSSTEEGFRPSVQALDRILTAGRYVVPVWYSDRARMAHSAHLHHGDKIPLFGDWPGYMPDYWWHED